MIRNLSICLFVSLVISLGTISDAKAAVKDRLETIERELGTVQSVATRFAQTKELSVLNKALELQGYLFLEKPFEFAWHVVSPLRYSMIVKDDSVMQWDEDSDTEQRCSLSGNPIMQMVFDQMQGWISGDYVGMLDDYVVQELSAEPLCIEFAPRSHVMAAELIQTVTITFAADLKYITTLAILEKSGDRTVLQFVDTVVDQKIDASCWQPGYKG